MTYVTNTLTDANAPATLYAALATALTAEGYTLVDTNVISPRTHKIWKCPAASNPANLDWYLDIAYTTTGAGTLGLYVMEYFDPATDLAYRAPWYYYQTGYTPETTYYSKHGATGYTLENPNLAIYAGATQGSTTANRDLTIPNTTFGYWASVTPKRVVLLTSNSPTTVLYAGLYEPHADFAAQAGGLMFPLISARYTGAQASFTQGDVSLSRFPKEVSSMSWNYRVFSDPGAILPSLGGFVSIPSGLTTLSAVRRAIKVPISTYYAGGGATALYGYLYDMLAATTSAVRGDTVTVGGASYVFASPGASYPGSILFKAV